MLGSMAGAKKVRAAEWAKRVERWQRSGLSAAKFGAREGIAGGQLSWWKWHLGRKAATGPRDPARGKIKFVPARVVERAAPARSDGRVELVLSNGRVVRVVGAVDAKVLTDMLQVIEALG
jgi:transposase